MQFLSDYLERVKAANLYRQTIAYDPIDATHVSHNGQTYLMLAANNYLGLTHNRFVQQAAIEALGRYGTGSGGARLTTGTYPLFVELEKELAAFKGTEAALVFNTGYMANLGVITALAGPEDVVFSDELNHASIIDGCRLSKANVAVYRHADMAHLEELLKRTVCRGRRLIVTDGVFSMDGDIAPLADIVELAERYNCLVVVDDAHATGVIGPGGKGTAAHFGVEANVQVQIGTLSKALGAEGGFVAGSALLIDFIRNKARSFIFSTALSPAVIAAARAALQVIRERPAIVTALRENAEFVRMRLQQAAIPVLVGSTPIIPIMIGAADSAIRLTAELKAQGLIITAIRPPTVPAGTSRLRLTVSAAHSKKELAAAADKIITAVTKLKMTER